MEFYVGKTLESQANANGIEIQWVDTEEGLSSSIEQPLQSKNYNKTCFYIEEKPQGLLDQKNLIDEQTEQ